MDMKIDGGPAFPSTVRREERYMDEGGYGHTRIVSTLEGGMTLRDWFAGQAVEGIISSFNLNSDWSHADRAEFAYRQADAMLIERAKSH